jgi:hypothetical protein
MRYGTEFAAYIGSGSPWEKGYIGSFNAHLRDEHCWTGKSSIL